MSLHLRSLELINPTLESRNQSKDFFLGSPKKSPKKGLQCGGKREVSVNEQMILNEWINKTRLLNILNINSLSKQGKLQNL